MPNFCLILSKQTILATKASHRLMFWSRMSILKIADLGGGERKKPLAYFCMKDWDFGKPILAKNSNLWRNLLAKLITLKTCLNKRQAFGTLDF